MLSYFHTVIPSYCHIQILYVEENRMNGMRNGRKGSPGIPGSPSKSNSDFPLRILVPSDMVGAIIGKDGATIRMITQLTKARVDVHRRENMGSAEKPITIIGPPECCTEACFQIMKIMQNELLMTSGMLENGKFHEPLPVVPLKVLAHNELVGRVIGKGGNTLKRIMSESGTKITISKLKDLTAYNMERTITILGTIDNCKKAESLISAKLRASYESDMAQFIPVSEQTQGVYSQPPNLSPSPTNIPPSPNPLSSDFRRMPQSLPATPTSVRTFTDFSGEHKRLTTLHGSTGALEVSNLGGFKLGSAIAMSSGLNGMMNGAGIGGGGVNGIGMNGGGMGGVHVAVGQGSVPLQGKYSGAFESSIDGFVKSGAMSTPTTPLPEFVPMTISNGMRGVNGVGGGITKTSPPGPLHTPIAEVDDEISDVFTTLSVKDPMVAAPGYGRGRFRRSSAPVNTSMQHVWGSVTVGELAGEISTPNGGPSLDVVGAGGMGGLMGGNRGYANSTVSSGSGFNGWNAPTALSGVPVTTVPPQTPATASNIWSGGLQPMVTSQQGSRPNSQTSSYSNSSEPGSSSLSAFSPIYSPTIGNSSNGFFSQQEPVSSSSSGLLVSASPLGVTSSENHNQPAFKAISMAVSNCSNFSADSIPTSTITSVIPEEDDLLPTSCAMDHGFSHELPIPAIASHW
jgi:rRNA processing protein Krr1/Pno1